MSRTVLNLAVAGGVIGLLASVIAVKTLSAAGQFTTVRPLGGESCQEAATIVGAEDIAIDRTNGVAYVSSTDRAALRRGEAARGEIFKVDLRAARSAPAPLPATAGVPADFRPDGLSLWTSPAGEQRLFVVNRRGEAGPTVEIFAVALDGLTHLRTVGDPSITSPNDVQAVGPDRFYVTNDGGRGAMRFVDFALQNLGSGVIYFDGQAAHAAATGFGFANGIGASRDGRTIYVTDTFTRRLRFFSTEPGIGTLSETGSLLLGTGLDNVDVDGEGALWIAAHPRLLDLALYTGGWSDRAPSQVIRAVPGPDGGGEARTVLLDLGERISAASVAAAYDGHYLVGSLMDAKVLLCAVSGGN